MLGFNGEVAFQKYYVFVKVLGHYSCRQRKVELEPNIYLSTYIVIENIFLKIISLALNYCPLEVGEKRNTSIKDFRGQ